MKKVNKDSMVPPLLSAFYLANPNANWESFTGNDQTGCKEVQYTLRADQRKICAYCENILADFNGQGLDDFRVEHFHPKSPHTPPPNWSLDWSNLLGVCTGGNARYVGQTSLFTSPDYSCDVPKGNKNLTSQILNPVVDIPAFPPIFEFDEDGKMKVGALCPTPLKLKSQKSIDELRLSPAPTTEIPEPRLIRFRKAVLDKLRENLAELTAQGMPLEDAAATLAQIYFSPDVRHSWPAFFSCIRWYLGPAAEKQLQQIQYAG